MLPQGCVLGSDLGRSAAKVAVQEGICEDVTFEQRLEDKGSRSGGWGGRV